jgi:ribulose-phosphate 3-epimerase
MDCHMMVAQPEKVQRVSLFASLLTDSLAIIKWVNDIADAGGSLYCFHIEATCWLSPHP